MTVGRPSLSQIVDHEMLAERVGRFIEEEGLLAPGAGVLVGLSGGVDSVVLVHLLRRLGYAVTAAHVHHGLRSAAADADEDFVRSYCRSLDVPLRVVRVDAKAQAVRHGQSVQEAGRVLRYRSFEQVAAQEKLQRVAVAHHRDDQAETLLLNLLRGSGVEGLAGMPVRRPLRPESEVLLIRPLLRTRRAEIEAYARHEGLVWRTDASNADRAYRRSIVREEILPLIEQRFEGAAERIAHTAELVRAYVTHTLRPQLRERWAACARAAKHGGGGYLRLDALCKEPPLWQNRLILEALRRWLPEAPQSTAAAEEVRALVEAQPGRRAELGSGTVWRERERLRFVPRPVREAVAAAHQLALGECLKLPGGTLCAEALAARPDALDPGTPNAAVLDRDRLCFPLTVRSWQPGDRLRPLGLRGHKKVSDLLTDAKVPPHRRKGVLVVLSGGEIVWVVGQRVAETARVRSSTRRCVRLVYTPTEVP